MLKNKHVFYKLDDFLNSEREIESSKKTIDLLNKKNTLEEKRKNDLKSKKNYNLVMLGLSILFSMVLINQILNGSENLIHLLYFSVSITTLFTFYFSFLIVKYFLGDATSYYDKIINSIIKKINNETLTYKKTDVKEIINNQKLHEDNIRKIKSSFSKDDLLLLIDEPLDSAYLKAIKEIIKFNNFKMKEEFSLMTINKEKLNNIEKRKNNIEKAEEDFKTLLSNLNDWTDKTRKEKQYRNY